jgi:hypothetical protein
VGAFDDMGGKVALLLDAVFSSFVLTPPKGEGAFDDNGGKDELLGGAATFFVISSVAFLGVEKEKEVPVVLAGAAKFTFANGFLDPDLLDSLVAVSVFLILTIRRVKVVASEEDVNDEGGAVDVVVVVGAVGIVVAGELGAVNRLFDTSVVVDAAKRGDSAGAKGFLGGDFNGAREITFLRLAFAASWRICFSRKDARSCFFVGTISDTMAHSPSFKCNFRSGCNRKITARGNTLQL